MVREHESVGRILREAQVADRWEERDQRFEWGGEGREEGESRLEKAVRRRMSCRASRDRRREECVSGR